MYATKMVTCKGDRITERGSYIEQGIENTIVKGREGERESGIVKGRAQAGTLSSGKFNLFTAAVKAS